MTGKRRTGDEERDRLRWRWGYALYRYYDAAGGLLYTGISDNPDERWRQHVREHFADPEGKPWPPLAVRREDEWFATEAEAEAAERQAIADEGAIHNKSRKAPQFYALRGGTTKHPEVWPSGPVPLRRKRA